MRSLARRGTVLVAAALAAATFNAPSASAGPVSVPAGQAGTLEVWGAAPGGDPAPVRAHYGNAAYVAVERGGTNDGVTLGIRGTGAVDVLDGSSLANLATVPAGLDGNAAGIDLTPSHAVGWDKSGKAYSWGGARALSVTSLNGVQVTQVAATPTWGVAVASDGTLKPLGSVTLPAVLTSASEPGFVPVTKVAVGGGTTAVALRQDGTLVVWGSNATADVSGASNVVDVAVSGNVVVAVKMDGTLQQWQGVESHLPTGDDFVSVAATDFALAALDESGHVSAWGKVANDSVASRMTGVPAELRTRAFAGLGGSARQFIGIAPGAPSGVEIVQTAPASVAGAAQAGQTLTATPATFSGSASVSHEWLADGVAISGASSTTLVLGPDQVGKKITYRSVATAGTTSISADADPTTTVEPDDSLTVVTKGAVAGTLRSGETLTATPATFSEPAAVLSYQWFVGGKPVEGATGLTFTLRPQDAGTAGVQFRTTATLGDTEVSDLSPHRGPIEALAPLKVDVKGRITGTPRVGQVLTGTAAKFNDASATVTRQWLVGGQPVVGATGATFTPTAAHVGKPVVLRTTATRGTDTVTDEVSTANVAPATVPKASTSVAVSGATTAAYGSTVRWTVTVRGGSPAGGTVTVAGSGVNVRATVSRGRAVVTLPRTLAPAGRTLRVAYSGDGTHLASYRNLGLRVVKANVSAAAKVTKKPTSRKAGKVRVTVRGAGPVRAGGNVTVTIQKGSKRYTVRGNVRSNGTVDLTLRKLAKGTWTVKAVYAGDARYNARATGAVRVKVSK